MASESFGVPLTVRLDTLERRMGRVEDALNSLLSRFALPRIEKDSGNVPQPTAKPVAKDGPYVYKQLDVSRKEIRILAVQNSLSEKDPIRCELVHVGLDDKPATMRTPASMKAAHILRIYNTLSYTWGDPEKTGGVVIDGHQFPVTKNLEAALRAMRRAKSQAAYVPQTVNAPPSYWWIDAICINQDDILERNQQVLYMTRIYKNGMGVHVWLGDGDDNSSMALDLARKLGTYVKKGPGDPETVYPDDPIEKKIQNWQALTALFQRPWWDRCWVRQEVAVPVFVTVHCGDQSCQFSAVVAAANILNNMNEQLGFKPVDHEAFNLGASTGGTIKLSCYVRACLLADVRKESGHGAMAKYMDFKELLFHTRTCKATDLRDKVFSVLGLVDPEFYGMKADYRLPIKDVIVQAARCIITKKQALDLLSGCQNPDRVNDLPSWVPNLLDEWKARPFKFEGHYYIEPVRTPDFTFDGEDNLVLKAKGMCLDTIETLSDDTVQSDNTGEELDALYGHWKAFATLALAKPNIDYSDQRYLEQGLLAKRNDQSWLEFLSVGVDSGRDMRYSEDGQTLLPLAQSAVVDSYMNAKMANSLLLPKDEDDEAVKVSAYHKIHSYLRKYGVGRKLSITANSKIGLVPAEAEVGDVVVGFRGTVFPYVLRKVGDECVVVGEARECFVF